MIKGFSGQIGPGTVYELRNSGYTATVKGGPGGVTDAAGNPRGGDHSWTFTTAAPPPPPPDEGPGGPILVVADGSNPFGRYYAEILRAEGLNEFAVADLGAIDASMLDGYDVVVLGEADLTAVQAQTLSDWVTGGGNLVAMRPDAELAGLLGVTPAGAPLAEGYLDVNTGSGPGAGIVDGTIQYHGAADLYTASDTATIATLYSDATTPTSSPAVTLRSVGPNGGQAAAFTYDLARSVVYTRQGNPAWAGQSRDGQAGPIRADNLFFGDAAGDPQPDWVDRDRIAIPQADEQQRLLANLIGEMNADRMPLPRFWYFPRGEKAVVVMTGDDHAGGGTAGRFDQYGELSPAGCAVADWECIRSTSYVFPGSPLTNAQAAGYEADGFEVAMHLSTGCADFTPLSLEQDLTDQLGQFAARYPDVGAPATSRTHCIAWSDWASVPKAELDHGIRLDTNYYFWPPSWVDDTPGLFTGSGMPMRFADTDGSMIDVYQAPTQMTDESGQSYPFTADALLDRALGTEGYYGAFVANMHTDSASSAGSDAIVASAQARDVPVVSSAQMLRWLDGRNGSAFNGIGWNGSRLRFTIEVGSGANGLRAMVPAESAAGTLTGVTRNEESVATTVRTVKGEPYAFIDAAPGDYAATYEPDQAGPAISNVAEDLGPETATISWDTDEPSDSRVDYGTSPGSLGSTASDPGMGTSHSVGLSGLDPSTTYYYRVTSADASANATTEPGGAQPPRSFTTPAATLTDTTVADFSAGTTDADGYVAASGDGEVMLEPAVGAEFAGGPALPGGWSGTTWESQGGGAGGSAIVAGGRLAVDGAYAATGASFGPGRSLEFSASFGAAPFEHVGLTDGFTSAWALFSTNNASDQLYARTNTGSGSVDTPIPGALVGSEHRYRIEWGPGEVRYYVDGGLVATHTAAFGPDLSPAASDFNAGGPALSVDWIRMSPFPPSSSFDSRILDAGEAVNWQALNWTADTPAGTSVALQVRTGSTPTPDAGWSAFAPVAAPGGAIGGHSRYLQYRAVLEAGDGMRSPSLSEVSATYAPSGDTTAPTITTRTPAPGAAGVDRAATVEVGFSEPMNPATFDGSTVRLREQGGGADVAATVAYAGATTTLDPDADLEPGATYEVTVAGSVEDQSGNPLGADDSWTFTTAGLSLIDTTGSDFGAGTVGADAYVARSDDGEVTLRPAEGAEFEGASLPARRRAPRRRCQRRHGFHLRVGSLAGARRDVRRDPVPDRRVRRRPERAALGGVRHEGRRAALRPHPQRDDRDRHAAARGPARLPASVPDRVGPGRGPVLRRRRPRRHPLGRLRPGDAGADERPRPGRSRARARLVAGRPLSGGGQLRLAGPRRRWERRLGRARLGRRHARRHRDRDQRPHRRHPDPGRDLERVRPDRVERRRRPRRVALPAVPGAADQQRSRRDGGARPGLDRIRPRSRRDAAERHRAQPGARRHRGRGRLRRRRRLQRGDRPGDGRRLERAPAQAGQRRRRPRGRRCGGQHGDPRPGCGPRRRGHLRRHGGRLDRGRCRQPARGRRRLEVHGRRPAGRAGRHDGGGLLRRRSRLRSLRRG
ncbi:MAG: hypothetical protein EDQ89_11425 [Acidobacteria bacterium]|nr:MAG: hypothetical protein EDQ89_11425 [Acidobacteriota bacterium]